MSALARLAFQIDYYCIVCFLLLTCIAFPFAFVLHLWLQSQMTELDQPIETYGVSSITTHKAMRTPSTIMLFLHLQGTTPTSPAFECVFSQLEDGSVIDVFLAQQSKDAEIPIQGCRDTILPQHHCCHSNPKHVIVQGLGQFHPTSHANRHDCFLH